MTANKDFIAIVDHSENFLTLQYYLIDSGIAAKLSDSKALIVYLVLKRFARWHGPKTCFPSIPKIAELAFCSDRAIYRALTVLKNFAPPLLQVEKVTYRELKERGLLPGKYKASKVELNLYTILPIAPTLPLQTPTPAPQPESVKAAPEKKEPTKRGLADDLIGQWRKAKRGLLGQDAVVSNREANEIRRDLVVEYGRLGERILFMEVARFWLPKEKMTDLEKECVDKGRTVGALRWWLKRKDEQQGEVNAKKSEADRKLMKDEYAKKLARQVVKRHELSAKIDDWVHEELRLDPQMFGTGRLQQWLEKSSGLCDEKDVEYEAKRKIERWAEEQIAVRKAKRMKELQKADPVLWARLVIGRSPTPLETYLRDPLYATDGMKHYREAAKILLDEQTSQPQGAGEGDDHG